MLGIMYTMGFYYQVLIGRHLPFGCVSNCIIKTKPIPKNPAESLKYRHLFYFSVLSKQRKHGDHFMVGLT